MSDVMTRSTKLVFLFIILCYLCPLLFQILGRQLEESTGFNDYARITDMDYTAVLMDEEENGGNVLITERITFDVHAASENNLYWELWRDLPEDYVDGLKVDYKVNYVKQIHEDGTETVYEESPVLYWEDSDYTSSFYGPGKWYHSKGPYNEENRRYECIFFYVDGIYREQITFEIQYVMYNAALKYQDVSELYLAMYSGNTIPYLKSFQGEILIPKKDMPQEGNYLAHTYGTNQHVFPFQEDSMKYPGYYTFSFQLNQEDLQFKPYNEYLEFSLLAFNEDRHIFTDYAPDNVYSQDVYLDEALAEIRRYDNLPEKAKKDKVFFLVMTLFVAIAYLCYIFSQRKKVLKQHQFYKSSLDIKYFRDIPDKLDPCFAATFIFSKRHKKVHEADCYSALLLSLVRKKYISLEKIDSETELEKQNIRIRILYTPSFSVSLENPTIPADSYGRLLENLTENEEAFFNLIVSYAQNGTITMKQFSNRLRNGYSRVHSFIEAVHNSITNIGISKGYFQKAKYDELKRKTNRLAKQSFVIGLILLFLGNFILYHTRLDLAYGALFWMSLVLFIGTLLLKKWANEYLLFTQTGEDEYAKWKGLYDFLNSATLMDEKTIIELPLWEEYLIYATAFGIADKVIKALEMRNIDFSNSELLSNPYCRSHAIGTCGRTIYRSTWHSSGASGGFFGGGHYGGGGRGGGGGGGGH